MEGSICIYSFIPVRNAPSEGAELETQILFGETFSIIELQEKWAKISVDYGEYIGWIDRKLVYSITDKEYESWKKSKKWIVPAPYVKVVNVKDTAPQYISAGSEIVFNTSERNSFIIGNREYFLSGSINQDSKCPGLKETARGFLNAPYLWGGRFFLGLDCSGLTQVILKTQGVFVPRNASQQVELGENVNFVEEAMAGDLAFFGEKDDTINHVGMCLGKGEIIHASGEVRIDRFDHQGIFNAEIGKYTHKLRVIKRIIGK